MSGFRPSTIVELTTQGACDVSVVGRDRTDALEGLPTPISGHTTWSAHGPMGQIASKTPIYDSRQRPEHAFVEAGLRTERGKLRWELQATVDGPVVVQVSTSAVCVCWKPHYVAEIETQNANEATIRMMIQAAVWQRTGENWHNVRPYLGLRTTMKQ
ncbi:MAG: hypothetical protein R3A47_11145 [Polyangiales bacterium]